MHTGIQVGHAMTKNPVIVSKETNIKECAKEMIKHKVGSVLVIENKKLLGILTEKDIIEKVVLTEKEPKNVKAEQVMTNKITTTTPEEDIYKAILKMRNTSVRRLPVIENNEIIGLLTLKDILRIHPDLFDIIAEKIRIREEDKLYNLSGNCPSCGNFTILKRKDGQLVCDFCN